MSVDCAGNPAVLPSCATKSGKIMTHQFIFHQTAPGSGWIADRASRVAEIRDLQLCNVRFQRKGPVIIDETVPIPLYWRQYQNYQDPERNASSRAELLILQHEADELIVQCQGTNASASIASSYLIRLRYSEERSSYLFQVEARLTIRQGGRWLIARNPSHGEIEFCNLWPAHTFRAEAPALKKYEACYIQRGDHVVEIPHHHLESSDKNNIALHGGDRFFWALADANPVFELISGNLVSAGLCAYMWDAHFAYRATEPDQAELYLDGPREYRAQFSIYTLSRSVASRLVEKALVCLPVDVEDMPVYLDGVNSFNRTLLDFPKEYAARWPWSFESTGALTVPAVFSLDRNHGYSDHCALRIFSAHEGQFRWLATTLGPAFGNAPFPERASYRLTGYVKTENVESGSTLGIRLHCPGIGNLFNPKEYGHFFSPQTIRGTRDWQKIQVTTPVITPAPDRVHLLLQQNGQGQTWFDDIQLETIKDGD
jgi:hypothetical protein